MDWSDLEEFVEYASGVSRDSLHVFSGVCLQFAFAAAFKIPVCRWSPWWLVLIFATVNEFIDIVFEYWDLPAQQFGESAKDIVLTMFMPTVILVAAKYAPWLFQHPAEEAGHEVEDAAGR